MAKSPKANGATPALQLSVQHLMSQDDVRMMIANDDDIDLAEAFVRGATLTKRNNWINFGVVKDVKLTENHDKKKFCTIVSSEGNTSAMKLEPKKDRYGRAIPGTERWDTYYELQVIFKEYQDAGADLEVLISAHGNWKSDKYFDLVQVIV